MAGTTSDKLLAVLVSKESIRLAIEAKGIECGQDVPLSQYADKILSIPTEGSEGGMSGCGIPGIKYNFQVGEIAPGVEISGTRIGIEKIGEYVKQSIDN